MPTVTINGTEIEVDKGLSILRAAAEAGYDVPHFCYHPALSAPANCRMCLVEVDGWPKLQPGCFTQVSDGMKVETESDRVVKARKAVLEFILVNHPVDCPICDQAGECKLQDYYVDYDAQDSRLRSEKMAKVKAFPIGPKIVYDGERCILCTRCIRFCDEVTGTGELTVVERGDRAEIRAFPGRELDNNYSLCTVDICPVGALTARDFRFKCRVWLLTSTDSVCTGCAHGCNIHLDHFRNEVQRYRPRFNPDVNDHWMCDAGRTTYKDVHEDRMLDPLVNGAAVNWHAASEAASDKLQKLQDADALDKLAVVITPQASCEDLLVAKKFVDTLGVEHVYLGGKAHGDSDDFLIKADKNPNRRGIEAVWGNASQPSFQTLVKDIEAGRVSAVWMMGAWTPCDAETRQQFVELIDGLELFVLQSPHAAELSDKAHIALPACSHAEKDGTFVNDLGIAQPFHQAFRPHGLALPDWQIMMKVLAALGEPLSYTFLDEIREEMFAATQTPEAPVPEPAEAAPAPAE